MQYVIMILLFLSIFLFLLFWQARRTERKRKVEAQVVGMQVPTETVARTKRTIGSPVQLMMRMSTQAGMKTTPVQWTFALIFLTVFCAMIGYFWIGGIAGGFLFAVLGYMLPFFYLKWRKQRYYEAFRFGLLDLTEYGTNIFQVFDDVEVLLREVVKNSKNRVVVFECEEILRLSRLGDPVYKIMLERAEGSGVPEYKLLAKLTYSAKRVKGDLLHVYDDMNTNLQKLFQAEKRILAKTSGMRKMGIVIALLPFPVMLFMWPTIKSYLEGGFLIGFYVMIASLIVGMYLINRVVRVRA